MHEAPEGHNMKVTLPEVYWRLVVSFGGATDVLTLGMVGKTLWKLTREEMVGSVLLPTREHTIVVWDAATGGASTIELSYVPDDDDEPMGWVQSWSLTPDGQTLATVCADSYGDRRAPGDARCGVPLYGLVSRRKPPGLPGR